MWKDRSKVIELAKEFTELCEKHNIWYTADNGSMLGAIRHKGMIPWDDDFDAMMTVESFNQLKTKFPNRVIDTDEAGYPLLIPKFMKDKSEFMEKPVFVDIFLLIPSDELKVKEFTSFRNKTRFAMQCTHSKWEKFNLGSKIFWVISLPFKWIPKRITYQDGISILKSDKPTMHYTIDNPIDPINYNWQDTLSLKRKKVKFEDFSTYVPVEYERILTNKYGSDYMTPNKQARSIEHINAISIKKVNRKNKEY